MSKCFLTIQDLNNIFNNNNINNNNINKRHSFFTRLYLELKNDQR